MTDCKCICIDTQPIIVVGGLMILCLFGILVIMSNGGDNIITQGMNYMVNGEIYYIQHPTQLPSSPELWIIVGLIGLAKRDWIIWQLIRLHNLIKNTVKTDKITGKESE